MAALTTTWIITGVQRDHDEDSGAQVHTFTMRLKKNDAVNTGVPTGDMTLRITNATKANAVTVGDILQIDFTKL